MAAGAANTVDLSALGCALVVSEAETHRLGCAFTNSLAETGRLRSVLASARAAEAARLQAPVNGAGGTAVGAEAVERDRPACPALPVVIWTEVLNAVVASRDAAALARSFKAARSAYPYSKWPRAVRVERSGHVLEPATGTFDVTVAPGESVQAAVDRCPPGGCVLLLPGTHDGPLALAADKEVHVFGRGLATLQTDCEEVLISEAATATVDGLIIREIQADPGNRALVWIRVGRLRLQACDVAGETNWACVYITRASAVVATCRIHGARGAGVHFVYSDGRLEDCHIWGNIAGGVRMSASSSVSLVGCNIHDHVAGEMEASGCGVFVDADVTTGSKVTVTDCVFAGNEIDVFRQVHAPAAPPEMAALIGKPQPPRPAVHEHALKYTRSNVGRGRCRCRVALTELSGLFYCAPCRFICCVACFNRGGQ